MSTCTLSRPTMELHEALRYLRRNRIFLCYRHDGQVDVWSCGRKMPQPLRRSIYKHRHQLAAMMREAHPKVCPTYLHAFHWVLYRSTGRYVCLMCARLAV
jgi:hypothetical protein